MSRPDTAQERTEEATPRRREKAFEQGRVPRSQEFSGAVVLLAGVSAVGFGGGTVLGRTMETLMQASAGRIAGENWSVGLATHVLRTTGQDVLWGVAPILVGIAGLALAANALQARGVFSFEPMKPKLSHISPLSGFKRIVSLQSLATLVKSLVKLGFLTLVTYVFLNGVWPDVVALPHQEGPAILQAIVSLSLKLGATAGMAFLLVALGDYAFQVYQHGRSLRMTRQEVIQEHKEAEGDPLVKSRIRSIALAMSRKRMLRDVETADVVVVNPTRLAVALKYDLDVAPAPIVVAMGARKLAHRIRDIAKRANVPIVENKPLAQALMATAAVGQPIPPALYMAVAEVIAFVYRGRADKTAAVAAQARRS